MRDITFRVWYHPEKKMYFRGYQKVTHILLCRDDPETHEGKGIPVKKAKFSDCEMLETASCRDLNGIEIYEGDIVRVQSGDKKIVGVVEGIPDMFRSRGLHPLQPLIEKHALDPDDLTIEVVGNRYEHPERLNNL